MNYTSKQTHNSPRSSSWLRDQYVERRAKNASYSIRAFAKQLRIAAPRICDVMNDKRLMTVTMGKTIADRLELAPEKERELLKLIELDRGHKKTHKAHLGPSPQYTELREDVFNAIAGWHHFAILELTRLDGFQWDYKWMGAKLGISALEARQATERMIRLGLLTEDKGKLRLAQKSVSTTTDIPSSALRISHRQSMEMAIAALSEVAIDQRDITSMTVAVNPNNIPKAKALIKNFRRKLAKVLESGKKSEVYNINVQLVPVTKEVTND